MLTKKQLQALQRKRAEALTKRQGILDKAITEERGYSKEEREEVKQLQVSVDEYDELIREGEKLLETRDGLNNDGKPSGAEGDEPKDKRSIYIDPGEFVRDLYLAKTRGQVSDKLKNHRSWQDGALRKLNIDDGSSYGDLIPDNFEVGTLKFIGTGGYVRSKCKVISSGNKPAGKFKKRVLKQGQAGVYNGILVNFHGVGNVPVDESDLQFDMFTLDASDNKISLFYSTDRETLENTVGVSGDMQESFLGAKAELEDELAIKGDGIGKPLGILHEKSKGTLEVARDTTGQVKFADILLMAKHMYPRAKDVNWEISLDLYEQIAGLEDSQGRLIMIPGDATKGVPDILHGRAIHWNEFSPSAGDRGDIMLVSWSFYYLYDGSTYFFDVDKSTKFMQDEVIVKLTYRQDGDTWVKEPLKLKNKMNVSPFVVLAE